ncbi:hypothetical protein LEM8419_02823 [Neolewinella maritima]|uniref:ABC transmembrane type-1 domain-containing protein n=2 Tax=Neolewinella maritima TaxID=1383882 RepID=A0ABN8F5P7_9BACT|nr:hypothetical protein LEM8419_02823 [Neolewinella maritima]
MLRRLLYLPLSLLLLSLLCFAFMQLSPGDPVEQRMAMQGTRAMSQDPAAYFTRYRRLATELGYDLPPFYLTLSNASLPDTLHRIVVATQRRTVRALAVRYGNWPATQQYYRAVLRLAYHLPGARDASITAARKLLTHSAPAFITRELAVLGGADGRDIRAAFTALVAGASPSTTLWPRVIWHGTANQYHRYLMGLLRGELGISYTDRRPVAQKIARALPRTALLNGLALFLVYLLAVPLGMYMAYYRDSTFDRAATFLTFLGFGIPSFWVATLLANFLTTPAFGMDYFPSMGYGDVPPGAGWWMGLRITSSHLLLPVACLTYPSLAYVARHLRAAALLQLRQPYVNTALMKGMTGAQVLWRHVFRNAAFPLVTLLGGLLPALLAGSVLIEQVFNLPGMGRLLYTSALARDWPVVTALVLLNGLVTVLGLLLADIGYLLLDPRLRLEKRRQL